jgi:hypothetical protein
MLGSRSDEGDETFPPVEPEPLVAEDIPDEQLFPGLEAQVRWNVSAGLVILELDRAEEAIEDEDLDELKACLARARTVAELGRRPPSETGS